MNPSFLVLLSFLICGGSGDLLDYVPTHSYWHDRNVEVTVDAMQREAAPTASVDASKIITDLGAADPHVRDKASDNILKLGIGTLPQLRQAATGADPETAERSAQLITQLRPLITVGAVRRLMALRALGELKDAKAVPFLQSQLSSQEMFVADYARNAIGAIYGQPARHVIPKAAVDEVWLLPSNCRAVAQLLPRGNGPIDAEKAAAQIPVQGGPDSEQLIANLSKTALHVAEKLGDMRLDALNVGVSENIDDNHGCLTLIASGQFDSANAVRILHEQHAATRSVNRVQIFEPDGESTMIFPSDHEFVMMIAPSGEQTPLDEMITTLKTREQTLRKSPEMTALVEALLKHDANASHALWITIKVTDAYRKVSGLDGFNTVTLIGDEQNGTLNVTASGESPDAQTAGAAVQQLTRMAAEGTAILKLILPTQPSVQPALDFLASVKFQNNANLVTGSATLQETPAELFMLPLFVGLNMRGE
jgi:hypothetical protein